MGLLVASLAVVGCTGPQGSPGPSGSCENVRAAGVYPDLEALLPRGMIERSPDTLDSGRNCTTELLDTLETHGVHELRFAGATWDYQDGDATVVAILTTAPPQPALDSAWVEEFYETGARRSTKTENIEVTRPEMGEAGRVYRLDTLNDLSLQTVVIWPSGVFTHVVIVATRVNPDASREAHDQRVQVAVDVTAQLPMPEPLPS